MDRLAHSIENLTYGEIWSNVITPDKKYDARLKQLKIFYKLQESAGYKVSIINAAVLYALRVNKGLLPSSKYLEKTLTTVFGKCKTTQDAVSILYNRLEFEKQRKELRSEVKKAHYDRNFQDAVRKQVEHKVGEVIRSRTKTTG